VPHGIYLVRLPSLPGLPGLRMAVGQERKETIMSHTLNALQQFRAQLDELYINSYITEAAWSMGTGKINQEIDNKLKISAH
jgi:hypothetical protein